MQKFLYAVKIIPAYHIVYQTKSQTQRSELQHKIYECVCIVRWLKCRLKAIVADVYTFIGGVCEGLWGQDDAQP